jgi:uncharacterized protein YoxC
MLKLRDSLSTFLFCSTLLVTCAYAQSNNLTQIRDTVTNVDGSPFNGTVVITWNGYVNSSGASVSPLSTSARIYNGALSVLLVPSTTAAAGTYYQAVYNSNDGRVTWTETWAVPPSTTPLLLSQVRQSSSPGGGGSGGSGSSGGSGGSGGIQYATLPIAIGQVTNLQSDLDAINASLTTLTTAGNGNTNAISGLTTTVNGLSSTVTANGSAISNLTTTVNGLSSTVSTNGNAISGLTTTVNGLSSTVTANGSAISNLTTTVNGLSSTVTANGSAISNLTTTVNGMSLTVTSNSTALAGLNTTVTGLSSTVSGLVSTVNTLSSGSTTVAFVDAQTPSGTLDGTNVNFTLANAPSPAGSLELYRNGVLQTAGVDFTLSGSAITFASNSVPQPTDILEAYYRIPGSGPAAAFADNETPGGTINGTNVTFTLAAAPNPAASLRLSKNGALLQQNGDYTLSGQTITFVSTAVTPQPGDSLVASYRH